MTERKTVAGAYHKLETHEKECALRYEALHTAITDVKDGLKWAIKILVGVAFAVTGWLAVQLYDGNARAIEKIQAAAEK